MMREIIRPIRLITPTYGGTDCFPDCTCLKRVFYESRNILYFTRRIFNIE